MVQTNPQLAPADKPATTAYMALGLANSSLDSLADGASYNTVTDDEATMQADVDIQGETATRLGQKGVVQLLLDHGGDVNKADAVVGEFPLAIAAEDDLLDHGAGVRNDALINAARKGHEETVRLLLKIHDAGVGAALFIAASKGHAGIVQRLLEHGADKTTNLRFGAIYFPKMTALIVAARKGHGKIVQLLLDHRANVNIHDTDGDTALFLAAWKGHTAIVQMLLEHGADINAINFEGMTALTIAAHNGHEEIVQLLLDHHANVDMHTLRVAMGLEKIRSPFQASRTEGDLGVCSLGSYETSFSLFKRRFLLLYLGMQLNLCFRFYNDLISPLF
jgi:Ankyrin repeats (3 copies)/Ankyrin repeat